MMRRLAAVALLHGLVGCGGAGAPPPVVAGAPASPPPEAPTPSAAPRQLEADTPMKSPSGATFEAPKGWFVTEAGAVVTLVSPEREVTLRLVEIQGAAAAPAAIAAAWAKTQPGFARKPRHTMNPPLKDGWEAITQIVYETGGAEARTVVGVARKKGGTHYVTLLDAADAGLDRRGAQLGTIVSTFKAPGVGEESFAGRAALPLDPERLARLDRFIEEAMALASVPGAAIAIVQDGRVVHAKGFGERELGKKAKVTPDTLFMIGSTTKSLTTLMMAKLVDDGRFGWDTPVVKILPSFALGDAALTEKVTMRHTVCACTGMPRQDMEFLFEYDGVTPEARVASMRGMKPTTGFGETFQYSNTMVATGGYVAAHALDARAKLGPAYDRAMQSLVFGPLGMKSTTFDVAAVKAREHASPHGRDLRLASHPLRLADEGGVVPVRPAGAAWSSVRDMAQYVSLELASGKDTRAKSIVSEANLKMRRTPQIKITDKLSYGLGLFVEQDHGVALVQHGGNNLGFTSDMYFMPDHGVGVVMLANAGGANAFRRSVRRRVMELLFDGKEEARKSLEFAVGQERAMLEKEVARVSFEPDASWVRELVGAYKNDALGTLTIRVEGKKAILDAGEWKSAFGQKTSADGVVKMVLLEPPIPGLEFTPSESGGRRTLTLDMPQQKYGFEKIGPKAE